MAGPGEGQPEVKLAATRFVEAAGTWGGGAGGAGETVAVAGRLAAAGADPALAEQVAVLSDVDAVAASVTVDYPQHGGLTATAASVMTLLTQRLLMADGDVVERQLTVDVRLGRASADEAWAVTAVSPDDVAPVPGVRSPVAEEVLANPDIRLPEPAVRDIEEGRINESVLRLLQGLGLEHVIDVHVLYSGHPTNVFATERPSNHSVGRAVDIWRVDGHLVVDPGTPRELLETVMLRAGQLGATEVGGPFDLNGERPRFFTDVVHADHLHLGVTEGRSPAVP